MDCPKCKAAMEPVRFETVEIDRCTSCRGIWLDAGEKEELRKLVGSEAVDSGDRQAGRKSNEVRRIDCPVCHTPMIAMSDPKQPHIHFESCTACYGLFFDAGEFTDFKEHSILDYIRDFMDRG